MDLKKERILESGKEREDGIERNSSKRKKDLKRQCHKIFSHQFVFNNLTPGP